MSDDDDNVELAVKSPASAVVVPLKPVKRKRSAKSSLRAPSDGKTKQTKMVAFGIDTVTAIPARSSFLDAEPQQPPKKKKQKTDIKDRLEIAMLKTTTQTKIAKSADDVMAVTKKHKGKGKAVTQKHIDALKKTRKASPAKRKKKSKKKDDDDDAMRCHNSSSDDDDDNAEDDDDDERAPVQDGTESEQSMSSETERKKARSRAERRKASPAGNTQKAVALCVRAEAVAKTNKKFAERRQSAEADQTIADLWKTLANNSAETSVKTLHDLLSTYPHTAQPPPPQPAQLISEAAAVAAASALSSSQPVPDKEKDEPVYRMPFNHPLIQALSNLPLATPTLERYGESLTSSQLSDQLKSRRVAVPLLTAQDLSALLIESGPMATQDGRVIKLPACMNGIRCQGKLGNISGLEEMPLKQRPVLMAFMYPHELKSHMTSHLPFRWLRPCRLCLEVAFGEVILAIRTHSYSVHVDEAVHLAWYRVSVDTPGGFERDYTWQPDCYEGFMDPFPRVDVTCLRAVFNAATNRWRIDDSITHYNQDRSLTPDVSSNNVDTNTTPPTTPLPGSGGGGVVRHTVYASISIKTSAAIAAAAKNAIDSSSYGKADTSTAGASSSSRAKSGKHRTRQSEREQVIKANRVYSRVSMRLLYGRCTVRMHVNRLSELLVHIGDSKELIAVFRQLLDAPSIRHALSTSQEMLTTRVHDELSALVLAVFRSSGYSLRQPDDYDSDTKGPYKGSKNEAECVKRYVEQWAAEKQARKSPLFIQYTRLGVLAWILEHLNEAYHPDKEEDTQYAVYNASVYHTQCMVDSLWHVPYVICKDLVAAHCHRHIEWPYSDGFYYDPITRATVASMNHTSHGVVCDMTIPFISEYDRVYCMSQEKGKNVPIIHYLKKVMMTRNNRRKFRTVVWNYAELDQWFKDFVIRIMMTGLLGNYLCLKRRRPSHQMSLQARFALYHFRHDTIRGDRNAGNEFFRWLFMDMEHAALYTTHSYSVDRLVHLPALKAHCEKLMRFKRYRSVVEIACSFASATLIEHVLSDDRYLSVHCLSVSPIPDMKKTAMKVDTLLKKECENLFLKLVYHKTATGFLSSLKEYTRYYPTVVWDAPHDQTLFPLRLQPLLESLIGAASYGVLEYLVDFKPYDEKEMTELLQHSTPVRYCHLSLMRKAVRSLSPLTPYPEIHLFNLMPLLGCSRKGINLVQDALMAHEVDDKNARSNAIASLRESYPFTYSTLQLYAELWRLNGVAATYPLPLHYYNAQVGAIRKRYHLPSQDPSAPLPDFATHLLFCHCCDCACQLVRLAGTVQRPKSTDTASAPILSSPLTTATPGAIGITLGPRAWDQGTVQACVRLPDSPDGFPTVHCIDEKRYLREKCGERPLSKILLLGKLLMFKGKMIMLCVGDGCAQPCVIDPRVCEYGVNGYLCAVCSDLKRKTGRDFSVHEPSASVDQPQNQHQGTRDSYYVHARKDMYDKKKSVEKKKAPSVVCDACSAKTTRPRIVTVTQEASRKRNSNDDDDDMDMMKTNTLVLTLCGMHHEDRLKYDMQRREIEQVRNPSCSATLCTCKTVERTCTGMWTKESALSMLLNLDRNLPELIQARSLRKQTKMLKLNPTKQQRRPRKTRNVRR